MCVQCPETLALIKHTHSLLQTFPGCLWEEIWSQRVGLPPGSPLTLSSWSACHASHTHILVQLSMGSPGRCWAPQHGPSAADGGTTGFPDTLRLAGVPALKPEMVFDTEAVGAKSRLSWRTTCELCNDLWRGWWLLQHNSRPSFGTLPAWQSKSGAPFHCTGTVSPQRQTEAKRANFSSFFFFSTQETDEKVGCFFFLFFTASWQGAVHWITFLSTKPKPSWCFAGRE